jgi:hypothetical protein
MIRCRCPSCGNVVEAADAAGGKKTPCPGCGQRLLIPPPRDKTVLAPRVEGDGGPATRLGIPEAETQRPDPAPGPLELPSAPSLEPYRPPQSADSPPPSQRPAPPPEAEDRPEEAGGSEEERRPRRRRADWPDDEDDDVRPRRRPRWEDEDDDYPRFRRRRPLYRPCPRCGCEDRPRQVKKFGGASIALLVIGIIFWPLILVAFFVQEIWDECPECGERLRQVGTGF